MGTALILLMMTEELLIILFFVALFALGAAFSFPTIASLVSIKSPGKSGSALGQFRAVSSLGQASGPVVGGILYVYNIHAPYVLAAVLLFLAVIYYFKGMRNIIYLQH
jgi:DHA1 family multidrug resistance protein-like MFS transporter